MVCRVKTSGYSQRTSMLLCVVTLVLTSSSVVHAQNCGSSLSATDTRQPIVAPAVGGALDCQWTIATSDPQQYVILSVEEISVPASPNCERDRIEVWLNGVIIYGETPKRLCGDDVGKWNFFFSENQQLLVRFISGGLIPGQTFSFSLTYIAETEMEPRLLWTDIQSGEGRSRVHSLPADPDEYLTIGQITTRFYYQTTPGSWLALAADRKERCVFWSDSAGQRIIRGSIGQHSTGKVIFGGSSPDVRGIAVDVMSKVVYLTDALYNWIVATPYDGSLVMRLVTTGLDVPSGIAVHPQECYLFWTDCGAHPRIERSDLAGKNRVVLVSTQLTTPNGITVDFLTQRIYWTNAGSLINSVEFARFDGGGRSTLFSVPSFESSLLHIAIFQDYVFVSDQRQQLRCGRKSTPGSQYFGINLDAVPHGMAVFDLDSQPDVESPCASNPCSHLCVGAVGSPGYKCLCLDGQSLMPDNMTCQHETAFAPPQLFMALQSKLCRWPSNFPTMAINPEDELTCFLSGRDQNVAMEADIADRILFFSDIVKKTINLVSLVEDSSIQILTGGTESVEGIAVDWISNNVYWTDNPAGKISVSTYTGHRMELITTDVTRPRSIAVDPLVGYLFWGEFGAPAQIERSDLDGRNREILVSDGIQQPNGLVLDYSQQRLYFADSQTGAIQTVRYNGEGRAVFYQKTAPATHNYFGMTIFQDYLIWSEFGVGNGLYVANRNTGELVRHFPITEEAVFSVTMYADSSQPEGEGPCSVDNGGCNQICLPSKTAGDGRFCYCSFGFYLEDDGVTCNSYLVEDNFVLLTDTYSRKIYQIDLTDPEYDPNGLSLGVIQNPIAVAYDPQEKRVYWSDVLAHTISRAGLDGSGAEVLISEDIQVPDGLTIEPVNRLLFWTDTGTRTISVSMLSGHRRVTVISDGLERPRAIALDPVDGYMYWSDWGTVAKIERSFWDGTGRQVVTNTGLGWPNGLAVDIIGRKLYWCDAQVNKVEMSDLDGGNRVTLFSPSVNIHPYGIGVDGSYMFYTDWAHSGLVRADKADMANNQPVGSGEIRRPNEIHVYNSSVPWEGYSACRDDNGGCTGLCLSSANGRRSCHCGDSTTLGSDGTSCVGEGGRCSVSFELGALESCSGNIGETCTVTCWSGLVRKITSVICLPTLDWDEDLSTVCEEEEVIHEPPPVPTLAPEQPDLPVFSPGSELEVTIVPSATILQIGSRLRLSCDVSAADAQVSWEKDGVPLQHGSAVDGMLLHERSLLITSFSFSHQGQYRCDAYRDADRAHGADIHTLGLPTEVVFNSSPVSITIELTGDGLMECSAVNPRHTVSWEKDGEPLVRNEHAMLGFESPFPELGDTLLFFDVTPAEAGRYTCIILEDNNRIGEVSADVTVDTRELVSDVCGTITAREAINTEAFAGIDQTSRIEGGRKAIHGSAPWMVRLYDRSTRQHFCGGSLINNFWVLTAAHCIMESEIDAQQLLIRLGDYSTWRTDDSEKTSLVREIYLHEGYDASTFDNDIALIRLEHPIFTFTDYIRPICLPDLVTARQIYKGGNQGKVTGFGRIAEIGRLPQYMSEVTLPLVGRRRCQSSTNYTVTPNMFCAGYLRASGDACQGDSGGPFAVENAGRWYLFGIVSWGEGCGRVGKYGFYTRYSKFIDWANGIMDQ